MTPRGAAAACLALVLVAAPAAAEVRQIEAEGAVLLGTPSAGELPPRDEAVRLALVEAVGRVAMDLLPDADETTAAYLPEVLGDDPLAYATRYRVIEDLGERPAIRSDAPPGAFEYAVLVEAHIDADRVASRLTSAGLLARRSPRAAGRDVLVVLEPLGSFAAYDSLRRTLLDGVRVAGIVPLELSQERGVLRVRSDAGPERLLEGLLRAAPPELLVTPLGSPRDDVLRLRVGLQAAALGANPDGSAAAPGAAPLRD